MRRSLPRRKAETIPIFAVWHEGETMGAKAMNHIEQIKAVIRDMKSIAACDDYGMIQDWAFRLSAIVEGMHSTSAEQTGAEPVAWLRGDELRLNHGCWNDERAISKGWVPLYAAPQVPACRIALPKVTDEIWEDYNETDLLTWKDGAPHWTQLAVDFACLLKGWCIERLSESPQVPDGMVLVGTVIKPSGGIDYIRWNVVYESIPAGTKLYAQIAAAKEEADETKPAVGPEANA